MSVITFYIIGIIANAGLMFYYLRRHRWLWVFNAASLVWCVGSVVRLMGVMT